MKYTQLGRTGLKVSRLTLGTMNFGPFTNEPDSHSLMDAALDAGVNYFDTANVYGQGAGKGRTEEIIGTWFTQGGERRDKVVLATKVYGTMTRQGEEVWPNHDRLSALNIRRSVEASLRRLQTDYIDLYQVHFWDPETPIDETLAALDDLVRGGKVRYVGCSNTLAYQLARSIGRSEVLGVVRFESVQPRYNLLFRENERELFPLCDEEQVAVIPYNPLAGGLLTGKHRTGAPTEGTRFTLGAAAGRYQDKYWHERMFASVEEIRAVAEDAGVPMATLAVRWVLDNPVITAPILGASRPDQLDAAVAALDAPLDADVRQRLDELTREYRFGDLQR